ncbi:hypothetical protein [Corynebacterium endometrii]|uniref:Uncharacterized protein n=1 Tax=Corynebacterium endometrii TaxID=2488819 RepID=A0A4P7QDW4_9CORY|nr:hypothetical protein [Corynebacterium endometrii]QCB27609.1 hypothetical protein CENDO_01535 [Corynebacterium endometrii]
MADDKQLTVAELLARNKAERDAKASSRDEAPRRRRRRSLDEGGISVAELTGNLPKVDANPAQSKHSSVGIDEPAPVIPAPKKQPAPVRDQAPAGSDPEIKDQAKQAKAESKAGAKPSSKEGAKPGVIKPHNDETTVIKRVEAQEAESKKPQAQKVDTAKAGAKLKEKDKLEETGVIPVVTPEAGEDKRGALAKPEEKAAERAAEKAEKKNSADGAKAEAVEEDGLDTFGEDVEEEAREEDSKVNPVAVIILALIGVVLGTVVFKGFEILWTALNGVLVGVLALVVTGVMVGVIHALRTNTDKVSMGLAGVVGLVLTFGPLLIV